MTKGHRIFASSYITLKNGTTLYIRETIERFFQQFLDTNCKEVKCHLSYFLKREVIYISKEDVYHFGKIFPF